MEKVARPARICVTGAESTGKSELALRLATHFSVPIAPEYARDYAESVARRLDASDVEPIARGQIEREDRLSGSDLVILDTDLLSTVVYSRHHYGSCPAWIADQARRRKADLYLLLDIDVLWLPDPVRDCGDTRSELHRAFLKTLEEFKAAYVVISGSWEQRFRRAAEIVERMKDEG